MENKNMETEFVVASARIIGNSTTASSSSTSLVQPNPPNQHSSEEPVAKKSRHNESIDSSFNTELYTQQEETLPYLPAEMLDMILSNVSSSDLLNCRLVSHRWNDISAHILEERDDYSVHFTLSDGDFVHVIRRFHGKTYRMNVCGPFCAFRPKTLTDLVDFLKESKLFPFTSFRFDGMCTDSLRLGSMTEFLTVWGSKILSLKVRRPVLTRTLDVLRKSIFEEFPNLRMLTFLLELPRRESKTFMRHRNGN